MKVDTGSKEIALAEIQCKCVVCGAAVGHIFECPKRPKGTAAVAQLDWRIIEELIAAYSGNKL